MAAGAEETRERLRRKLPWLALAAGCLAADLWTKHVVFYPHVLAPGFDPDHGLLVARVASWFQIVIAYNQGVTFGLGSQANAWVLAALTAGVIALLAWKLWTAPQGGRTRLVALSIVVGGATGNLYDRALRPFVEADRHPGVRDFLDWYVPDHWGLAEWLRSHGVTTHWYTFNVADSLIVSGVVLLAWRTLREKPEEPAEAGAEAEA